MIVGWILLNLAILFGIIVVCVILGAIVGVMADKRDVECWIAFAILGFFVGIILSIIGFVISLIAWGIWLVGL